jgi:hypothetical protein
MVFKALRQKRVDALMLVWLTFFCQLLLVVEIFSYLATNTDQRQAIATMNFVIFISFGRFVCAIILHLSLIEEIEGAMKMMKYVANHSYMFDNPRNAFMIAFM